jgi:hypothetical protein
MSEITDLGSPDRELSAGDIKRKKGKLKNVIEKLKDSNLSGRRRHNLEFKREKTLDQITTGKSGIRPVKQPYEGPSRKSSSPINNLMKDGEAVPSTEGVYRKSALNMLGISPLNDMTKQENDPIDYSNLTSEQKTSLGNFWDKEIKNYGGNITPGNEGYNELVGENAYAVYDRGRFQPDGKGGGSYPYETPRWRTRHGGTDGKPKHIAADQTFKMYQGKNNIYE